MTHYICTGGCAGMSDQPGTCQAEDCDHWGKPLEQCDCADGQHSNGGLAPVEEQEEEKEV